MLVLSPLNPLPLKSDELTRVDHHEVEHTAAEEVRDGEVWQGAVEVELVCEEEREDEGEEVHEEVFHEGGDEEALQGGQNVPGQTGKRGMM
jgi:hypothetical protein